MLYYNIVNLAYLPNVIFPLIYVGSFLRSAIAAKGIPQLATGPQKCVLKKKKRKY